MGERISTWKNALISSLARCAEQAVITGFNEFGVANKPRRALLSYLVIPLLPPPTFRDRVKFSNRGIAQQMVQGLNEIGYVVDVVNFNNCSWLPSKDYDLFIGHGGKNFERLSHHLPQSLPRIYFSTGLYWREWNIRLARRIYDLTLRRGFLLPAHRDISSDEEYANQTTQGIICLGNKMAVNSYSKFPKAIGINNANFPIQYEGWRQKDYRQGRKHFLFFSGRGNVLKGLDLLLETFAQTDLHLHICQHIEADFAHVYKYELERPNIHVHGFVTMRSPEFEALAARCNWVISATCAEGQPGAILECMGHGLIPILPDTANIDVGRWGIRLPDCDVETIRSIVTESAEMSVEESRQRAECVAQTTREDYSVENFREAFKNAVKALNEFA